MELIYYPEDIISDRYLIIQQLGEGGSGITYAAKDLTNDETVAIKVLSLYRLDDWKKVELFTREAKILQQLEYPGIPQYLDYFKIETDDNFSFYIVQQLAPGQSLSTLVNNGWQPNLTTVKNIAEQILDILIYLQQLTPPVIHRDLKPQNIIYQPDTGKLFLVDFGAVQDTYHHTVMGSTVVGTYGYMAPEQFRGGAVLATDLYSLGCTLLFLLTGQSPAELPQENLKINFRSTIQIESNFANWLDKLIAPDIGDRFPTAIDSLKVLHDKELIGDYQNSKPKKPAYSLIELTYYQRKLIISLPPASSYSKKTRFYYQFLIWNIFTTANIIAIALCFNILFLGYIWIALLIIGLSVSREISRIIYTLQFFIFIITVIIALYHTFLNIIFYISFIIVFVLFLSNSLLRYKLIREITCQTKVECSQYQIFVKRKGFDWSIDTLFNKGESWNINKYTFGYFLTEAEKRWLTTEINKYIDGVLDFETISGKKRDTIKQTIDKFFLELQ